MLVSRYPVILASESPRRKELLARLFRTFRIIPPHLDEASAIHQGEALAHFLARAKAKKVFCQHPSSLVISADTVVLINGESLSKPTSEEDAIEMLQRLSGRTHQVVTAVAVICPEGEISFTESTRVSFHELSLEEIVLYVKSGEPMDKAGAYAIQGEAEKFVASISGDKDTVIGLPILRLREELLRAGWAKEEPT
ncbi:MAG: Maf family protein [Candidatus Caldarchaeum sp.]